MVPVFVLFGLASCTDVEIAGANETRVWIRNPVLSITNSNTLAQERCSIYGKTAVLESDLSVGGASDFILAYTCN
ncbi:MAG: hypothetical protein HQ501_02585 [Rhodospirillales bacterium]|nr:hypothetical protein [Rhodospirillales bacterium]